MNRSTLAGTALCLAGFASAGHADPLWPLDDKFNVSLGVFFLDTETTMRLDGDAGRVGTEVNFGRELGLKSGDRFRIDGYWRFFDRHKLRFMYFDSKEGNTRTINRDIEFGDTTFPLNVEVRTDIKVEIFELAYEYSFLKRDNLELSGTIGLHNLSVKAGLHADASSNAGLGGLDLEEAADGDGPLPVVGLRGLWALNDHFYFDAQVQFFAVKFDNYDGNLQDYKLSFNWQPFEHFGVGLGYNDFSTRLDVDEEHFNGKLRFNYDGPLLFVTGAF
ncbi:MAG TPA: hypothetical protein PKE27_02030 [Povalibacter sp.]|uniref:hypothetical protein n=1 Tax=Povalibacter sp. TaxID=1962978 RepID=UPI002B7929AD|nr:hypothetical protein [Povalibacter sp.]HMN43319.1 hypothetical protein [Povalibacter sp.]